MRFYLASWIGDGSGENPYRPNVGEGSWSGLDLRPDPTTQSGRVLVATPAPLATVPRGVLDLGEDLDGRSVGIRNQLGRDLSLSLGQDTLRGVLTELLILHGRHDGTRWKPLRPSRDGVNRLYLGGLIFEAPAIVGATITESFDQADSTTLGPDLTWTEFGNLETVSNRVRIAAKFHQEARADSDLDGSDHYAQLDVWTTSGNGNVNAFGPRVRQSDSAETAYVGHISDGSSASVQFSRVLKIVVDVVSTLQETTGRGQGWWTNGTTLRLSADGSTLTLEGPVGTTLETLTDTSIPGNVRTGIHGYTNGAFALAQQEGDNFEAGDLAAGGTPGSVTPAAIGLSTTIPSAGTAGAAVVAPSALSATLAIPNSTQAGGGVSAPAGIALAATMDAVTVVGPAIATPGAISPALALPLSTQAVPTSTAPGVSALSVVLDAVTVAGAATTQPAATAASLTMPANTEAGGGVVAPASLDAAAVIPSPTPAGAAANQPAQIALAVTIPTVVLVGSGVASPSQIDAVLAIGSATATEGAAAATVTPDEISAVLAMPAASVSGAGVATFDEIVAAIDMATPTVSGGGVVAPDDVTLTFTLPAVTPQETGAASPVATATTVTIPAVSVVGPAVVAPGVVALAVSIPSAGFGNTNFSGIYQEGGLIVAVQEGGLAVEMVEGGLTVGTQEGAL